jgi:hypothetical protein
MGCDFFQSSALSHVIWPDQHGQLARRYNFAGFRGNAEQLVSVLGLALSHFFHHIPKLPRPVVTRKPWGKRPVRCRAAARLRGFSSTMVGNARSRADMDSGR